MGISSSISALLKGNASDAYRRDLNRLTDNDSVYRVSSWVLTCQVGNLTPAAAV